MTINISVIMPIYNEEEFLERSLNALMKQTLKPSQVIVVDDGSTDKSAKIAAKFPVRLIKLPLEKKSMIERLPYVIGTGTKYLNDFDYLAILDGDTILEIDYYHKLVQKFQEAPKIGVAGGKLIGKGISSGLMLGLVPYVYGCNRLYSKECWLKINNGKIMKPVPVWDFYHNVYAEMLGYSSKRFLDIKSWALRPPGFKKAFIKGYTSYQIGYYGYFLLLRALRSHSPGLIAGYLKAALIEKTDYPIKKYVRQLQTYRLLKLIHKIL